MDGARTTAEVPAGPVEDSALKQPLLTMLEVPATIPSTRAWHSSIGIWYLCTRIVGSSTAESIPSESEVQRDSSSKSDN